MRPSVRVNVLLSREPWERTTCLMPLRFGTDVWSMPMRALMGRGWECHFLSLAAWGCGDGDNGSRAGVETGHCAGLRRGS
eukprot:2138468-Alexandrium_andersonii.AAC.1